MCIDNVAGPITPVNMRWPEVNNVVNDRPAGPGISLVAEVRDGTVDGLLSHQNILEIKQC